AESDQKDKMRHAMDDNGIPSKEIHERHCERAITAEEAPDDTKRTNESRTELALDPKTFNSSEWRNFQKYTISNLKL
ncbi:hypothetical protein Tco_0608062, partial [Tanacetum coccineum]